MTQTISRLYSDPQNATAAVAALKSGGFADGAISTVTPGTVPNEELDEIIMQGGVPTAQAPTYAEGVLRGETLVSVRAPFGFAILAAEILTRFDPTETGLPDDGYEPEPRDPAAPLSSAWGWKVLLDNPTPLSSLMRLPTLLTRRSPPRPDSELVDDPAPFSKKIGMEVLVDKPAILSQRFGWQVLSRRQTPPATRFGMALLSDDPAPLSSSVGMPLLSKNPAPLSTRFGWRLLSDNPAPLSARFGWRVSSRDPAPPPSWFRRLFS